MVFKNPYESEPFTVPVIAEASGVSITGQTITSSQSAVTAETVAAEVVLPKTWDDIRKERDILIASCDWCMLPDAPLSDTLKAEMVVYRQELRDITKMFDTPERVMWPYSPLDRAALIKKYNLVIGVRTNAAGDFGPDWADSNATTDANTVSSANTVSNASTTTN
jgi:hypothetical protein